MTTKNKSYETAEIKQLSGSKAEIAGLISASHLESFRSRALKNINESVSIDGFRKGMIPENILIAKVGDMAILEEMAELALSQAYLDIIIDNKIDAIGKPTIKITKIAKDNPLEFTITTAVMPKIDLPDYKKIAGEIVRKADKDTHKVSEKDVEDAILRIRKAHVSHEDHDHDKMTPEEHEKAVMDNLPELNDEFVKGLGDFKDVADFREKVTVMLGEQKANEEKDKRRAKIADDIVEATKTEIPEMLVESELDRIEAQFSADVEHMGVKVEDYLKHAKKTIEEIRKEWRPHAEKKAKLQLIVSAIAEKESIKPDPKEVEKEVEAIMQGYKEADRERATTYAETLLTNQMVFDWLESQ